ncbi:hypothetical protein [Sphingobacterium anhuiense]|uniref:hypothetical protein n=1 Tax=Sphingobacterium anhuiense TaxID=493780 RepID=UPI003C2E0553
MGNKKQITKKTSPIVTMLRTDYEILVHTYKLFKESDQDEEDVSFLLGKPNTYYFDLLDPTEKKKLKHEYIPLFVPIFGVSLDAILPETKNADEEVKIRATSKFNKKSIIYKHEVTYADGTVSNEIEWSRKLQKGVRSVENKRLTAYIKFLIDEGYFLKPRTALYLFIHIKAYFHFEYSVKDLRVSLAKLLRTDLGKIPVLKRKIFNARYTYCKV